MHFNVKNLRFIRPNGELIQSSTEECTHEETLIECNISNGEDEFHSLLDVAKKGFAIIVVLVNCVIITHLTDLSEAQINSIDTLKAHLELPVCVCRDEI